MNRLGVIVQNVLKDFFLEDSRAWDRPDRARDRSDKARDRSDGARDSSKN